MKVTLNWLKQYVDFTWTPDELTERLTMLGLEVEGVRKLAGEFEGIVVAEVITRDKHPNADKLSLCRVNDGKGERQIVCGAQNFTAGDKVPLILPGASLPLKPGEKEPFTIKVGKIRGVESHGMLCSPRELGLADDAEGLLILRPEAPVGQPFAEYLGRSGSDVVYDLEVTPNRPDLNSVIGIAREIAAFTGNPLRIPDAGITAPLSVVGADPAELVGQWVQVRVEQPELCPRYTARILRGVKVAPSPDWLRTALEKVGVRSINNVVDVTNYVMLETGQPLHAFDYHLIAPTTQGKPAVVVRRARPGEKFITLDDQERSLSAEMLLIADEQKGIALAGIMGGQNTEIQNTTRDVLIESAHFKPANIRRTSKTLGLRSESSYRFERGADVSICDWASRRAAQLILQTAGGELLAGSVDVHPAPAEQRRIQLRPEKTNALLGIEIPEVEQTQSLERLGLELVAPGTFRIPTFRVDLKQEIDLIEEVCRLAGINRIPATPPRGAIGTNAFDVVYDQIAEARRILTGLGLNEAQGQTLISDSAARRSASPDSLVQLSNPLSSDMNVLRPSLLPGLLDSLRHNLSRKNGDVALFEIGRVFLQTGGVRREERRVAFAITGRRELPFWSGDDRGGKFGVYDVKGLVDEFLEQFGLRGLAYSKRSESSTLLLESASIQLGGKLLIGELGQLLPPVARQYDLRDPVFLAELNLDQLLSRRQAAKAFKPLPAFPSSERDIAMILPETVTHEAVLGVIKRARPENLESVQLFDIFRGANVPEGHKSMAYAFTYRNPERTLTDAEVNAAHQNVVTKLQSELNAVLRG
jgi:phenylalanyl-tRNA synthetase beta chain